MKLLILFSILLLITCDSEKIIEPVEKLEDTFQYKQITGIDTALLSLDVYYNSNVSSTKPVVIYVHGGGWTIGDKANQLDNKINLFLSLNYILVSLNYRLSPLPYEILNPNRIKYPDHNIDIADAIKWIYSNIEQYGGNKNKLALMGHSAGAQIVALTGTNKNFLEQTGLTLSNIKGVAVIDTEGFDVNEQVANGSNPLMYINAFGADVDQYMNASPIYNVKNNLSFPKFFVAKRGIPKRIGYADDFINTLEINDVSVSQVNGSIYDHDEINNAIGEPNETLITEPLIQFFNDCFE